MALSRSFRSNAESVYHDTGMCVWGTNRGAEPLAIAYCSPGPSPHESGTFHTVVRTVYTACLALVFCVDDERGKMLDRYQQA